MPQDRRGSPVSMVFAARYASSGKRASRVWQAAQGFAGRVW